MTRDDQGFTLVEALIAATIFFASIAVVSEAYRASVAASRRAQALATMVSPLPLLVAQTAEHLRAAPANERFVDHGVVMGVEFVVTAQAASSVAPAEKLDVESGARVRYAPRFKLFDVEIKLSVAGQHRTFKYRELTWLVPQVSS